MNKKEFLEKYRNGENSGMQLIAYPLAYLIGNKINRNDLMNFARDGMIKNLSSFNLKDMKEFMNDLLEVIKSESDNNERR